MTIKIRTDLFSEENEFGKMSINIQEQVTIFKTEQMNNQGQRQSPLKKMKKIAPRKAQETSNKVTCRICDKKIIVASMSSHTRVVHCLTLREYKSIYGEIYHQCEVCGERVIQDIIELKLHLKMKNHGLTFKDYNTKFMVLKGMHGSLKMEKKTIPDSSRDEMEREETLDDITAQQLLDKIDLLLDGIL